MAFREKLAVLESAIWNNFLSFAGAIIGLLFHQAANWIWRSKLNKDGKMLEGKELQGNIGSVGFYEVDVTPELELDVSVGLKLPLVKYLKDLAAKTATPIDDKAIEWIEAVLAKKPESGAQ